MFELDFKNCHIIIIKHGCRRLPIITVRDENKLDIPLNHVHITHIDAYTFKIEFVDLTLFEEPKELIYSGTVFYE